VQKSTIGIRNPLYLRIKRLITAGPSNNYFYAYWSQDGIAWNLVWSGQIRDATYFHENHLLYPIELRYCDATLESFTPEDTRYYQYVTDIVAQRFWPDSPEVLIVNNSGVDWAFDAGFGFVWDWDSASDTKSEPGTSSIKYKVGVSDTGAFGDITWIDATWKTIAEVSANAAAGLYNGYRYTHVKAQFNSDGTDKPTLTDFTMAGTPVLVGIASGAFEPSIFRSHVFRRI